MLDLAWRKNGTRNCKRCDAHYHRQRRIRLGLPVRSVRGSYQKATHTIKRLERAWGCANIAATMKKKPKAKPVLFVDRECVQIVSWDGRKLVVKRG